MEVLQYTRKDNRLEHLRKPRPKLEHPKDVLVKICFSGISHTDLQVIDGKLPCNMERSICLGREMSGIVASVGTNVLSVQKGNMVVVDPNVMCGICNFCREGTPHFCKTCEANVPVGGWQDYVLVPESQVYKIPKGLGLQQGMLAEELACVSHGLDMIAPINLGTKILIVGTGMTGALWSALLHFQGHRDVTVCDPNLARLEYVKKKTEFNCVTPVMLEEKHKGDPEYLFDVILNTGGCAAAIELEFNLLNFGGKLCMFGAQTPNVKINICPFDMCKKKLQILGVTASALYFPQALILLQALAQQYLDFEDLSVKSYQLRDFANAIDHVKNGSVVKAMFALAISCACSDKQKPPI